MPAGHHRNQESAKAMDTRRLHLRRPGIRATAVIVSVQAVQLMVDALLDRARAEHSGVRLGVAQIASSISSAANRPVPV